MIFFNKDPLFEIKNKNIYACLVKQEDLEDKNFQLRTPMIELTNKEELVSLIKNKYQNFDKAFLFFIKQLEKYLGVEYASLYKTKYRYLQNFKKNKINIVFLRIISLSLANSMENSTKLFNKFLINKNYIKIENLKLKINNFNKRISYLVGVITGDGHLNKKDSNISIYDGQSDKYKLELSRQYVGFVNNLFKAEFNKKGKIYKKKENCWVCVVNSKWLSRFINYYFEIPFGKKSNIVEFPKLLKGLNEKYFWRGMMDTDGFIREQGKQISLKSNSLVLIKQFKAFCKKNNIIADIRKEKRGWAIRILTESYLNYANVIGSLHPRKRALLMFYLKQGPKYKIAKTNDPLLKFLRPYKDCVYISFSQYNKKTNKRVVKKLVNSIAKNFNVKITEVKRNRYNNNYYVCSKEFLDFVKNNVTYTLPWQSLNNDEVDKLSKRWQL